MPFAREDLDSNCKKKWSAFLKLKLSGAAHANGCCQELTFVSILGEEDILKGGKSDIEAKIRA
jgi:hypothetical protein